MSNQRYDQVAFAIDCEMIDAAHTAHNFSKKFPIKVVIVGEDYGVVYDQFIRPRSRILCDNSWIHGISMTQVMQEGISFGQAQSEVDQILHGNLVVGHDLVADLKAMELEDEIPMELRRDTSTARFAISLGDYKSTVATGQWRIFAKIRTPPNNGWEKPSLQVLASLHLNEKIQQDFHNAIEDAITAMKLYNKFKHFTVHDWSKPSPTKP